MIFVNAKVYLVKYSKIMSGTPVKNFERGFQCSGQLRWLELGFC